MSEYITYKTKGRYAMGWTDPRIAVGRGAFLQIGDYTFSDLYLPSETQMDISFTPLHGEAWGIRVDKKELAAYIEAFLKEQHERNHSGL